MKIQYRAVDVSGVEAGPNPAEKWFDFVATVAGAIAAVMLILTFLFRVVTVDGQSMVPNLHHGDRLILTDVTTHYDRGEIVVISRADDDPLVKRVIATGGQEVVINFATKEIRVDGELYKDSHAVLKNFSDVIINRYTLFPEHNYDVDQKIFSATVPEGHIFVMGDNRNNSKDSRDPEIGFVDERCVLGKAIIRIFPFTIFP